MSCRLQESEVSGHVSTQNGSQIFNSTLFCRLICIIFTLHWIMSNSFILKRDLLIILQAFATVYLSFEQVILILIQTPLILLENKSDRLSDCISCKTDDIVSSITYL